MTNPFHLLHAKHPKMWCIVVFLPCVCITIVVAPIMFWYEVIVDIPRILRNLWSDIKYCFRHNGKVCKDLIDYAWKGWEEGWRRESTEKKA